MELFTLPCILYLVLAAATLVQVVYSLFIYGKLAAYRMPRGGRMPDRGDGEEVEAAGEPPVSVIIAARNESANLQRYLPAILEQNYPDFEVIVANDASYDDTGTVLRAMQEQYPRLRIVDIPENEKYRHGKKFALTMGVKAASNELLLFTDADCQPVSGEWIRLMQQPYAKEGTEIVLGVSPYAKRPGLLNAFIRYETFYTALNYLSFALAGMPYMGVGRNLSYRRSLFFNHKGFASHLHLRSGDDDLFVNQAARPGNTRIGYGQEAQTVSEPERSWGDYFRQKKRHQSVGKYYKGRHKFFLSLPALATILFYATFFALLAMQWNPVVLWATAGVKWLVQYIVFRSVMKRTGAGDLWLLLPFFDLFYHIYIVLMNLAPADAEHVQWK